MSQTNFLLDNFYHFEKIRADEIYLRQPINGKWIDLTWREVGIQVRTLAQKIKEMNFTEGSCIALLSKNCSHWIISDLAILMAGHISVPLYPTLGAQTIKYITKHSEAKLIIVGKLDEWDKQRNGVPQNIPQISFPYWENEGTQKWRDFIGETKPMRGEYRPCAQTISTIIYTSGTTGEPKGVVHTHESMSEVLIQYMKLSKLTTKDRFFSYLPLSHVAERLLIEIGSLYSGGTIYFAESLDTFKDNLVFAKPTIFLAVPRIWTKFQQGIINKLPQKKLDLLLKIPLISTLIKYKIKKGLGLELARINLTGAAAISKDLLCWFDKLGIKINEGYGMTENFGVSNINVPGISRYGCVGKILPGTEVNISESSEVITRSKSMMQGYYKSPEQTDQAIDKDGWLHTGDLGFFDKDGFLVLTGRVKDLFKTSKGKYIAPTHIENLFSMSGWIDQVIVLGSGMPQPMAIITLSVEGLALSKSKIESEMNELKNIINNRIESFEKVNHIIIVNDEWSIETGLITPTLKIKRNLLEKKYAAKIANWYEQNQAIIFEIV